MLKITAFVLVILFLHYLMTFNFDLLYFSRIVQLMLFALLFNYLILNRQTLDFERGAKVFLKIIALFIFVDIFMNRFTHSNKSMFGLIIFKRYLGPLGEGNYTSLCVMLLSLTCFYFKSYIYFLLGFLLIILCGSRASMLSLFAFGLMLLLYKIRYTRMVKVLSLIIFISVASFPILQGYGYKYLSGKQKDVLDVTSSQRSRLYTAYTNLILVKPFFGYGYSRGFEHYKKNPQKFGFYKPLQQHSLYLQFATDFGLVLFFCFIVGGGFFIFKLEGDLLIYLLPLIVNLSFINGFNEVMVYIYIAFIMKESEIVFKEFKVPSFHFFSKKYSRR